MFLYHTATDCAADTSSTPSITAATALTAIPKITNTNSPLSRYALWSEPRDVWCVKIDPLWIDFLGARSVGQSRSVPFVDAVPITLWMHGRSSSDQNANQLQTPIATQAAAPLSNSQSAEPFVLSVKNLQRTLDDDELYRQNMPSYSANNPFVSDAENYPNLAEDEESTTDDDPAMADLHVIAHISNLVSVQIDHFQFLFLLRLAEEITELTTFLSLDANRIMQNVSNLDCVDLKHFIPNIHLSLNVY